jgi:hypothetical protein
MKITDIKPFFYWHEDNSLQCPAVEFTICFVNGTECYVAMLLDHGAYLRVRDWRNLMLGVERFECPA